MANENNKINLSESQLQELIKAAKESGNEQVFWGGALVVALAWMDCDLKTWIAEKRDPKS